MLANEIKAMTKVMFAFNAVVTVTQFADMKKSMRAKKATMYRYNPRPLFIREQTPSAACDPVTAPMQQVRTDPTRRTKWHIQYPKGMALLRAAMSGRVVVCTLILQIS